MSIKQNGGVFGRNPTFNDVTIEGQLTFDGDIDINSDLKIDGNLIVDGTSTLDGATSVTGGNFYVSNGSVSTAGVLVDANGATLSFTRNTTSYIRNNAAGGQLTFTTNGNSAASVLNLGTTGNVTVGTGNLVIGTSGKGIDFSATAGTGTSELLDDYEEGTWTPTLVGAVSAGSYSVAVEDSSCKYTKVGRQVTVTGRFTITVSSAGSNYAKIGGLPFATSATNAMAGAVRTKGIGLAAGTVSLCTLNPTSGSVSYFAIGQSIDNASSVLLDIAGISSTDQITVTLTYFI
jgi:hypothetical protein